MAHGDKQGRAEAHHFSYVNHWRDTVGILLHSVCVYVCVSVSALAQSRCSTLKQFLCFSKLHN